MITWEQVANFNTEALQSRIPSWWYLVPVVLLVESLYRGTQNWYPGSQINQDVAVYYYSGRAWVVEGRVPYLETWDIKGPLTHEVTAGLALITDSIAQMNILGTAINATCLLGATVAFAVAARRLTGYRIAGAMVVLSVFYYQTMLGSVFAGFSPKYPVLLCTALTVLAVADDEWAVAAGSATAAAGFWQISAGLLLCVLGAVLYQSHHDPLSKRTEAAIAGAVAIPTLIAVGPFILAGGGPQLVSQVALAPIVSVGVTGSLTLGPYGLPFMIPAIAGLVVWATDVSDIKSITITACLLWWPVMQSVLAQNSPIDTTVAMGALTCAMGITLGYMLSRDSRLSVDNPVMWLLMITVLLVLEAPDPGYMQVWRGPFTDSLLRGTVPSRCHVRLSTRELSMISKTGAYIGERVCTPAFTI